MNGMIVPDDDQRHRALEAYCRAREAEARLELARFHANEASRHRAQQERTAVEAVELAGEIISDVAPAIFVVGAGMLIASLFSRGTK